MSELSELSEPTWAAAVEAADDPLYDAVAIAFVYAAWAATSVWVGDRAALVVLVGATTLLTVAALSRQRPVWPVDRQRPFVVDFATILLYCASAIALGVLAVGALR